MSQVIISPLTVNANDELSEACIAGGAAERITRRTGRGHVPLFPEAPVTKWRYLNAILRRNTHKAFEPGQNEWPYMNQQIPTQMALVLGGGQQCRCLGIPSALCFGGYFIGAAEPNRRLRQHFLYFFPLPHRHDSLRPIFLTVIG